jgi:riboflavin kinase / FMN adenylyltransferase
LGYPTANLSIQSSYKLIPGEGIYAVTVDCEGTRFGGMLYIGNRPTLENKKLAIEVNIFDFNQDIYGTTITVNFIKFLRGDMKFANLDLLKEQLAQDKNASLKSLKEI